MFVFLLVLGAVVSAAGAALVASGAALHDGALDATLITSGMIAAVGGLILIGIAFGVRVLERIERALAVKPMPRATRPGEPVVAIERPSPPARIPFPPKSNAEARPAPPPLPPAIPAAPAVPSEAAAPTPREKIPNVVRAEIAAPAEDADITLSPRAPAARSEEGAGEAGNGYAPPRTNGAAPARPPPRLQVIPQPPNAAAAADPRKASVFDALWPKAQQRTGRGAQAAPAQAVAPPRIEPQALPLPQVSEPEPEPEPMNGVHETRGPISILKSGVVDGMAYTLYSDGSIEAQLPQGRLRFGSITELRNHIEQGS